MSPTFQSVSPCSTPPWTDRGGKTPDPVLWWVCDLFRPQHSHYWAGTFRTRGPLLWLQWPRPRGERGVIIGQLLFEGNSIIFCVLCFYWFMCCCFVVVVFFCCPPSEIQAGTKLSLNRQFVDERWSKHRVVTCLDWSPQVFKQLFIITPTVGSDFLRAAINSYMRLSTCHEN